MKNNLEAGSGTTRQKGHALYARFTPDRVFVGIVSLLLLLLSLLGMIVTCTRTDVIAASVKSSTYSGTKHTLAPGDTTTPPTTPTLTPTLTASPTSTPSPTATPSMLPTSTSNPKPSPTATSKPSPTVTIVPTTLPTSSTSSTPSISPTHASIKAVTHATPVVASIGSASSSQSTVQSQTPTTTPNPQTPQEHQNKTFPFIAFAIGVPGITATLVFLFIGWWLLRKRLIPQSNVKLPPSGASPWSRVRPNDTLNTTINNTLSLDDTIAQLSLSNNKMPLGSNGIAPFDVNIAPPAINNVPTFNGFVNNNTDSVVPTAVQHLANEMNQIRNARLIPIPDGISETNIPPIVSENSSSDNDEDAYEQWLHNNNTRNPDLNDVYLQELIKQFSDKSRAAHQQNEASFRNEQTDLASNDAQKT